MNKQAFDVFRVLSALSWWAKNSDPSAAGLTQSVGKLRGPIDCETSAEPGEEISKTKWSAARMLRPPAPATFVASNNSNPIRAERSRRRILATRKRNPVVRPGQKFLLLLKRCLCAEHNVRLSPLYAKPTFCPDCPDCDARSIGFEKSYQNSLSRVASV